MNILSSVVSSAVSAARPNFQFALLYSTTRSQEVLGDKQAIDSDGGIEATDLLTKEYDASTEVLQIDTENAQAAEDSDAFSRENQIYQNDSAVSQTGQSNANTAVQTQQTQVSQDGTNLSNLVSLSQVLITIGQYIAGLISQPYA